MNPIRVVLADDQVMFVESLRTVMEMRARDIEVLGVAHDGVAAVDMVAELSPDVVLLDVRMPVMDGVEAARLIHERHPRVQIVMLTTFDDDEYVLQALRYGAVGYILKSMSPRDLIAAVRAIKHGSVLIAPEIASRLIDQFQEKQGSLAAESEETQRWERDLSRREKQVLNLLSEGLDNRQIASALSIAEQTVKKHVSIIYSKIGVHDRVQLARLATRLELD